MTTAALDSALWYLGRGAGVLTLVLCTVTTVLGIGTRSGRTFGRLPRFAVATVHRSASLLAITFLVVHVGTLLFDPYAQLRIVDLVVPFLGNYRPLWLGLGTLALDLFAAVVVTSLLRNRIGLRGWRIVHWLAYAAWPVAVAHGLGTGTDNARWWLWGIAGACVLAVVAAVIWRLADTFTETALPRDLGDPYRRISLSHHDNPRPLESR